jgi:hypothetical protein
MLLAIVLCASLGQLAAEEPASVFKLPEDSKAVAFRLSKDQEIPEGAVTLTAVDVVGETSVPNKTGLAILNVKLLAFG